MDDCGVGRKGNLREMVLEGKILPVLLNLKQKIGIRSVLELANRILVIRFREIRSHRMNWRRLQHF